MRDNFSTLLLKSILSAVGLGIVIGFLVWFFVLKNIFLGDNFSASVSVVELKLFIAAVIFFSIVIFIPLSFILFMFWMSEHKNADINPQQRVSPVQSPSVKTSETKPKFKSTIIIATILAFIILIGTGSAMYLFVSGSKPKAQPAKYIYQISSTPTPDPTANWKTYTSDCDNLRFKAPEDLSISVLPATECNGNTSQVNYYAMLPIIITTPDKRTPFSQIEEMDITLPIPKTNRVTGEYIGNDVGKGLESVEQNLRSQSSTNQVQGLKIYYGLISGRKTLFYENTNSQDRTLVNPQTSYWCYCSTEQVYIDNGNSIIKITMLWKNTDANRGKEFKQILSTFKFTGIISKQQAVDKIKSLPDVKNFLSGVSSGNVSVDDAWQDSAESWKVWVYNDLPSNRATFAWYYVNKETGKVTKL